MERRLRRHRIRLAAATAAAVLTTVSTRAAVADNAVGCETGLVLGVTDADAARITTAFCRSVEDAGVTGRYRIAIMSVGGGVVVTATRAEPTTGEERTATLTSRDVDAAVRAAPGLVPQLASPKTSPAAAPREATRASPIPAAPPPPAGNDEAHEAHDERIGGREDPSPAPKDAPTPPPAHVAPNRGLLILGALIGAAGYVPAAVSAVPSTFGLLTYLCDRCEHNVGGVLLLVPVVGPLVFAAAHPNDFFLNDGGRAVSNDTKTALFASSIVQGAGLALIIAGFVVGSKEPPGRASALADAPAPKPHAFVLPGVANGIGLTAGVTTW